MVVLPPGQQQHYRLEWVPVWNSTSMHGPTRGAMGVHGMECPWDAGKSYTRTDRKLSWQRRIQHPCHKLVLQYHAGQRRKDPTQHNSHKQEETTTETRELETGITAPFIHCRAQ